MTERARDVANAARHNFKPLDNLGIDPARRKCLEFGPAKRTLKAIALPLPPLGGLADRLAHGKRNDCLQQSLQAISLSIVDPLIMAR